MILIEEIHQVAGRSEIPYEEAYRDELVPALDGDVRLLFFGWLPHGGGEGYEAVSLLVAADIDSVDAYQDRLQRGDLAAWWTSTEGMRYSLHSSLQSPAAGTELADVVVRSLPTTLEEHGPRMFRLDTGPVARPAHDSVARIAAEADASDRAVCSLFGAWSSYFGDMASPDVGLLYRVDDLDRFRDSFEVDDPFARWSGTVSPDHFIEGAATRRSRLVRTASWSPLV